jgi:CubicO group peptidase (beta-lactamase class C family)
MTSDATSCDRRRRLIAALAVIALAASPAAGQEPAGRVAPAAERIGQFLSRRMAEDQVPGAVVAVTGRDTLLLVVALGEADLARHRPVTATTLFEVGSLSKTITAAALLQMRDEGLVELDQPVTTYLPWLGLRSSAAAITPHHLLTHTAALPRDRDDIPSSPYGAVALRDLQLAVVPGKQFAYSNVGYQLLSLLMAEVEGRDFAEVVRRRVFEPLAMDASAAAITNDLRSRLATGYQYLHDDRPPHPARPVVPATWTEVGGGDAGVASTAMDLAALGRMLLGDGGGARHPVLSRETAALMLSRSVPAPPLGARARYGYGVILDSLDGRSVLWNSGGTVGFRSHLLVDPAAGLGVVVLMNGPGNARRVAEFALRTARAAAAGEVMPPVPALVPSTLISNAAEYPGEYGDVLGTTLVFEAGRDQLYLVADGERTPLERLGGDRFYANVPGWDLFPVQFGRDSAGRVVEVVYGGQWFAGAAHRGPRIWDYPGAWIGYLGHYRSRIPWYNNFRVVVRKGVLLMIAPEGTEEVLVPLDRPGWFRVGLDPASPERLQFDTVISGRALRATLSGVSYYRSFSP